MIQFANADYLFLILLIPFFYLFYALYRRGRNKKIALLGDINIVSRLMPERSKYKGWVRITLFSLAWLFFIVGVARPQIGARLKESNKKGSEIMIALDVSNSMLAEDYSPNRLDRAKLAISRIVDRLQGDRIGLIVFAGQSFVQLPITTDYVSAKIFLNSINTESVPVQGTALGEAIYTAIRGFSTDAQMGTNNKAIILITDGENHEDDPITAAKTAADVGIKVFTIGVGSPEGKPIPMNGELLKDKEGNIVVTKLDEKILEEVAIAGDGAYVKAGNTEFGLNPIINKLKELESEQYKSVVFEDFDEQFMYFFGIALFFLILEFLIGNRRIGKKMFSTALLIFIGTLSMYAQTDKKEVRLGNKYYKQGEIKEAEVEYRKALLKDSLSFAGNYNLGNTLMKAEDAENAEKAYSVILDSASKASISYDWNTPSKVSPTASSNYYHNLGNSYLKQKKYSEAVEAYKNSLRRNPNDMETKTNYAYAKKMMDDQQNQDQDQNQDQNQDNKDQNQDKDNKDQDNKEDNKDQDNKDQDNKDDKQDQDKDKDRSEERRVGKEC